jgi:hypothetical protein
MRKETLVFNHGDVLDKDMNCLSCHSHVVVGDGAVPEQRCLSCHNEPARLEKYTEPILLHEKHVTERKIECLNCHIEIRHSQVASMEELPTNCSSCHDQKHQAVKAYYMGVGGRGVEKNPAPMYLAGVDCKGCHTLSEQKGAGELVTKASLESCIKCHGEEVIPVYTGWDLHVENRTKAITSEYRNVLKTLRSKGLLKNASTKKRMEDARHNLTLMENVAGVHNVSFTHALASAIHLELNNALEEHGFSKRKTPWKVISYESECLQCHVGIEFINPKAFGRFRFNHYAHVVNAGFTCERCHEGTHKMGELRIGPSDCATCHHEKSTPTCTHCHGGHCRGKSLLSYVSR